MVDLLTCDLGLTDCRCLTQRGTTSPTCSRSGLAENRAHVLANMSPVRCRFFVRERAYENAGCTSTSVSRSSQLIIVIGSDPENGALSPGERTVCSISARPGPRLRNSHCKGSSLEKTCPTPGESRIING